MFKEKEGRVCAIPLHEDIPMEKRSSGSKYTKAQAEYQGKRCVQQNTEDFLEERQLGANEESELTKLRNPTVRRMAWCYQSYDKPVIR